MKIIKLTLLIACVSGFTAAQTISPDRWMDQLSAQIGNTAFDQLVLPGACKSGLQKLTSGTAIPEKCNAQSQDTTAYGLLRRGARYIDMSLIYWKDNTWYLGQYNYTSLFGAQIAVGQSLEQFLQEIKNFISESRHSNEIVVLHISGHVDGKKTAPFTSPDGNLDSLQEKQLLGLLHDRLDPYLYKDHSLAAPVNSILEEVHAGQKKKSGALVVLYSSQDSLADRRPGIMQIAACSQASNAGILNAYKKTESTDTLLARWRWLEKQTGNTCYKIMPWILTWRSTDNRCTVHMAARSNKALDELLANTHDVLLPNVISIYFFDERLTHRCIRINQQIKRKF